MISAWYGSLSLGRVRSRGGGSGVWSGEVVRRLWDLREGGKRLEDLGARFGMPLATVEAFAAYRRGIREGVRHGR